MSSTHRRDATRAGQSVGALRVVTYARVSKREQADNGHGLDAQEAQLVAEIDRRGWQRVDEKVDKGLSGASMDGRNNLVEAIRMVESGEADVLMATKIDRVARSVVDFAKLIKRAKDNGWRLVVLDIGVDLTTATGRLVAHVLSAVAEFELNMISDRTKDGLTAARAKGQRLGAPVGVSDVLTERIATMRANGETLTDIAEQFTAEQIPTARGGTRWWPSTIRAVICRTNPTTDGEA